MQISLFAWHRTYKHKNTVKYCKNDQVITVVPKYDRNSEKGKITMENLERGRLLEKRIMLGNIEGSGERGRLIDSIKKP